MHKEYKHCQFIYTNTFFLIMNPCSVPQEKNNEVLQKVAHMNMNISA